MEIINFIYSHQLETIGFMFLVALAVRYALGRE
jgi:hypothetical protein